MEVENGCVCVCDIKTGRKTKQKTGSKNVISDGRDMMVLIGLCLCVILCAVEMNT